MKTKKTVADQPIPYLLNDAPIPYRIRVETPSPELRSFVVPKLSIQPSAPPAPESGLRLKVA